MDTRPTDGPVMRILLAQEATAEFFTGQPRLEPGEVGFWDVMGARADDIRPGDLVMARWQEQDGTHGVDEFIVGRLAPWNDLRDSCRVRFIDQATREPRSVGRLQPMTLNRWGTHRTLAGSL